MTWDELESLLRACPNRGSISTLEQGRKPWLHRNPVVLGDAEDFWVMKLWFKCLKTKTGLEKDNFCCESLLVMRRQQ